MIDRYTLAMHVSWVKKEYTGDTRYPEYNSAQWREVERIDYPDFTHVVYVCATTRADNVQ